MAYPTGRWSSTCGHSHRTRGIAPSWAQSGDGWCVKEHFAVTMCRTQGRRATSPALTLRWGMCTASSVCLYGGVAEPGQAENLGGQGS